MARKPTEELEQRTKELKEEILGYKQREENLQGERELEQEPKAIAEIIQNMLQEEMDDSQTELNVLNACLNITNSNYGMIGKINEEGNFDTTTYSSQTLVDCAFPEALAWELSTGMSIRGIWGFPMLHDKPLVCNDLTAHPARIGLPEGHVLIERFLGVPLKRHGETVGMVAVANKPADYSKEDKNTLVRLAAVISVSTQYRQVLTNYRQAEEALKKRTNDLTERVKELNCLYGISDLVEEPGTSLEQIIQGTTDLIPPSWQYPESTCARIILDGQEFKTNNFIETGWKQTSEIIVQAKRIGVLEVCYLEEKPEIDEGPFLKEERSLINAITERLGHIIERKQTDEALQESESRYRLLIETMNDGLGIRDENGFITFANEKFFEIIDHSKDDVIGRQVSDFLDDTNQNVLQEQLAGRRNGDRTPYEIEWCREDGKKIPTLMSPEPIYDPKGNFKGSFAVITDISELKKTEQALREREKELSIRTFNLEETNAALNVLLKRRDEDRIELEEKVLSNVKEIVFPYIERLEKHRLDDIQRGLLSIVKSNLSDIIAPFIRQLSSKYSNLTSKEIQVAGLVKEGKTSKEIAEMLISSTEAIAFHRKNLRKKLGLTNTKANLRSYLVSFPDK